MKEGEDPVMFSRRGAALDVWLGMIGAVIDLESAGKEDL